MGFNSGFRGLKKWRWTLTNGTDSGSCSLADSDISDVQSLDPVILESKVSFCVQ